MDPSLARAAEQLHREGTDLVDARAGRHLRAKIRHGDVLRFHLLRGQVAGEGDPLQELHLRSRGDREVVHGQVDRIEARFALRLPVDVHDISRRHGTGGNGQGGGRGFAFLRRRRRRARRGFVVERSVDPFLDPDHRFFKGQFRDHDLAGQKRTQLHPHPQRFRRGKVGAAVAQPHVGEDDACRWIEPQPRLPGDPELHPQRIGDGGFDPGFVGVHVDEEKDRDPRENDEGDKDTEGDEEFLHGATLPRRVTGTVLCPPALPAKRQGGSPFDAPGVFNG